MEFALNDELKMLQQTARQFAEKELLPYEKQCEEEDGLPEEIIKKIEKKALEAGLVGLEMP